MLLLFRKARPDRVCILLIVYSLSFFLLNYYFDAISTNKHLLKVYYLIYTLFEYLLFACILYLKITNKKFKKLILVLSLVFIGFATFYFLSFKYKTLDSIPIGVETILIFIYIIYYFNEMFRDTKNNLIYSNYIFWIFVGIMIYLGGLFFFNILANHLNSRELVQYWPLTFLADIVKNVLLTVSIFVYAANYVKNNIKSTSTVPHLDMV